MTSNGNPVSLSSPKFQAVAAICTSSGTEADRLIDGFVGQLQGQGRQVMGLRQRLKGDCASGCGIHLQSIDTGGYHRMTQELGSGSISCNVDAEALELLAVSLMNDLNKNVDLVVINRFGKREAEGAGFCCVIERAIELELPVLTVVKDAWRDTWLDYGGDWVTTLPMESAAIMQWYSSVKDANRLPA
jgi:nucleoside-triphosphatase THEP1